MVCRAYLLLLLIVASFFVAAQTRSRYDSVARLIQMAFNKREPLSMYALTGTVYQEKMDATAFAEGMNRFYSKTGVWQTFSEKKLQDSAITYTAVFENETQLLFLQLDKTGKILRFNFQPEPFVKTVKSKPVITNNPMLTYLDSMVERQVRPYIQQSHTSAICIAIISKGKTKYYSYGETKKGNGQLPDPEKTIFEIGSVTKTFTSLLLANAVVHRQVHLADPVNKYLNGRKPLLSSGGASITLQHLSNHTAGLPRLPENIFSGSVNPRDPYQHYHEDSLFRFLERYEPVIKPGTRFAYSNLGAGLLGCVLAQREHQSFERLIVDQICKPLKMESTKITLHRSDSLLLAQGYNEKGEATLLWNLASLQGSGAIRSTVSDMTKYIKAQLGITHSVLDKAIRLTHQPTFSSKENVMGLGWRIAVPAQASYLYHSGGTGGFRSFVGFDKKRQFGVVILANAAEDVTAIGQAIMAQ